MPSASQTGAPHGAPDQAPAARWRLGLPALPVLANCLAARARADAPARAGPSQPGPASNTDACPGDAWVALLCDPACVVILAPAPGRVSAPDWQQAPVAPNACAGAESQGAGAGRAAAAAPVAPAARAPNQAPPLPEPPPEPEQVQRLDLPRDAGLLCGAAWAPGGAMLALACQRAVFFAAAVAAPGRAPAAPGRAPAAPGQARGRDRGGRAACAPGAGERGAREGDAGAGSSADGGPELPGAAPSRDWIDMGGCLAVPAGAARGVEGGAGQERLELVLRVPLFFWPKACRPLLLISSMLGSGGSYYF